MLFFKFSCAFRHAPRAFRSPSALLRLFLFAKGTEVPLAIPGVPPSSPCQSQASPFYACQSRRSVFVPVNPGVLFSCLSIPAFRFRACQSRRSVFVPVNPVVLFSCLSIPALRFYACQSGVTLLCLSIRRSVFVPVNPLSFCFSVSVGPIPYRPVSPLSASPTEGWFRTARFLSLP